MKRISVARSLLAALLIAGPATGFAQQTQKTDGNSPTTTGPGSAAGKQKTDGDSPTMTGPGSAASKQRTDGDSPSMVGPGSGAAKQAAQSLSHGDPSQLKKN